MSVTARRRSRAADLPGASGAALRAEVARLAAAVDGLAVALIEAQEDLRELRGLMRAKGKAPPAGMVTLKTATMRAGTSYETGRRWCARGIVHAQRMGLRWFVSPSSLAAELAKRRKLAA
jgi:hypothetical protein